MKKIILLFLISSYSFAQEKYENYKSSYFDKEFYINISKEEDSSIKFWIETNSMDKTSRESLVIIESKNLENFKELLIKAKETYVKWKNTAIQNDVTELSKDLELENFNTSSGFKYGNWYFDFSTNLSFNFRVFKEKYLLILQSDELTTSSNKYIKSNGYVIVFDSQESVDLFLNKLDINKAQEFFNNKKTKEDLFKN